MQLKFETKGKGIGKAIQSAGRQAVFAAVQTVNDVAFASKREIQQAMQTAFDRPTPFVLGSVVVDKATREKPYAVVRIGYPGGKGVDPANVLQAEVYGGQRRAKRFEVALRRAGLLLPGMFAVPTREAPLDAYGNVPGSYIVRLLSALQAFSEQGYRANMTARKRGQLSGRGKWANGRFVAAGTKAYAKANGPSAYRKGGEEYFVSKGRGEFTGRGSWKHGKRQHLPAGVWVKRGLHGSDVRPLFLFVRSTNYRTRLQPFEIVRAVYARDFATRYAVRWEQARSTAR